MDNIEYNITVSSPTTSSQCDGGLALASGFSYCFICPLRILVCFDDKLVDVPTGQFIGLLQSAHALRPPVSFREYHRKK